MLLYIIIIIIILYFFKALHQVALSSLQYNRELKHLTCTLNHIHTHTQSFTHISKIMQTRMLQLQATVKRFQFDLYINLEGQQIIYILLLYIYNINYIYSLKTRYNLCFIEVHALRQKGNLPSLL